MNSTYKRKMQRRKYNGLAEYKKRRIGFIYFMSGHQQDGESSKNEKLRGRRHVGRPMKTWKDSIVQKKVKAYEKEEEDLHLEDLRRNMKQTMLLFFFFFKLVAQFIHINRTAYNCTTKQLFDCKLKKC